MRVPCWLGMTLCLIGAGQVCADPPDGSQPNMHGWRNWAKTCPAIGCCPDDYVRKRLPSILPFPRCGSANDYHRKPFPSVPAVHCGGPNDYCRKPFPHLLCPPASPWLSCGPDNGPCSGPQGR